MSWLYNLNLNRKLIAFLLIKAYQRRGVLSLLNEYSLTLYDLI